MINTFNDRFDDEVEKKPENKFNDNFVINSFSDKNTLQHYKNATLNLGLRESEKIIFQKYLNKNDHILDIGCGSGRTTFGLHELGYNKIVGLDITDAMIKNANDIAEEKGIKIDFVVGNAKKLDAQDDSYETVIFSFNGLMMIQGEENRLQVMKEIKRVLKNKGFFIFTTHDRNAYKEDRRIQFRKDEQERRKKGGQYPDLLEYGDLEYQSKDGDKMFIHIPNQKEIIKCLHETGLTLIENPLRSEITEESVSVEEFSKECRFRIAQKI